MTGIDHPARLAEVAAAGRNPGSNRGNQARDESTSMQPDTIWQALRSHWPEYLCEALELGIFMISAGLFTILLMHPSSAVRAWIPDSFIRRMLVGIAMGATAIAIVFSPLGKRSGAHFNPAVTLTFWRLGKVKGWDALFYILAQFLGGVTGLTIVAFFWRALLADMTVNFVATLPGPRGPRIAFIAEFLIAFGLMTTVLHVSNTPRLARYTGIFAGLLVAAYITFEAPFSGMSMNPARSFASAYVGSAWTALWIYFTAPVLAMQLAATVYARGKRQVYCAKYHHHNDARCIFNCRFPELARREMEQS
jgi:aquaporin Z